MFFLTSLPAFIASVLISVMTARWLFVTYKNKLVALCGTAVAGIALSIISDFTVAYSVDEYDRSFQMVIERAAMSAVISTIIGYLAIRSSAQSLKRRRWIRTLVFVAGVAVAL
jgi:predicted membrane protein